MARIRFRPDQSQPPQVGSSMKKEINLWTGKEAA